MVLNCYREMFNDCSNITNIGNINADWFSSRTPQAGMFGLCTKITTPITYANIPSGWKES
jgi:hypothetical protein